MDDKKNEYDAPARGHDSRGKRTVFGRPVHRILLGARIPVVDPGTDSEKDMAQESGKQDNFHRADTRVGGHEFGIPFEGGSFVVPEQKHVAGKMNNQKGAQKKSRQGDEDLLSHRRIEKTSFVTHWLGKIFRVSIQGIQKPEFRIQKEEDL
jgi:hypothetical protein